jgi:cobalt-zinc-cadmium efflux system outer membrane protein
MRLAALWGSHEPRFERALGSLAEVAPPPPLADLLARVEESPELARRVEEIERWEALVALEDAQRSPDVTANAGVRRIEESDDTALLFGVTVPLPSFNRNRGERLAVRRELSKARQLHRAARLRIETALRASANEVASSYAEIAALRDGALPKAESALRGVRDGYGRGLLRYVDVLDAQRTLFELRTRELDALRRYHGAVAEIERLTGAPVAELPLLGGPHS